MLVQEGGERPLNSGAKRDSQWQGPLVSAPVPSFSSLKYATKGRLGQYESS